MDKDTIEKLIPLVRDKKGWRDKVRILQDYGLVDKNIDVSLLHEYRSAIDWESELTKLLNYE